MAVSQNPRKVLLIDRDSNHTRMLVAQLKRRGVEALHAASLEDGLRLLPTFAPTVVLLDTSPLTTGTVGTDGISQIRESRPGAKLLVVSADADPSAAFRISRLGADEFLQKPFDLREAEERILQMVGATDE